MDIEKIKFKFVLIEVKYLKKEKYWFWLIEDMKDLCHYFHITDKVFITAYFKLKEKIKAGYHISNNEELAVYTALINSSNKTMVQDIIQISDKVKKPKINSILKGNKLLINSTNIGWCNFNKKYHKIIKIVKKDKCIRPEITKDDIHISRWNNGKHYYLKIGNHYFGKFETFRKAEKVAKEKFNNLLKGDNKNEE